MTDSRDHEGHCGFSGMDRKELYRNVLIEFNPWTTDRITGFKPTWQNI